ncbi:hypothetical protein ACFLTK_05290 [Chloroflexota bacterium]
MLVKTQIFELCQRKYANVSELAQAMEISTSQIDRVRQGKCDINQEFIIGAIKAFPEYEFNNLFGFTYENPSFAKNDPNN